jgi:hypothetical protein
MRNRFAVALEYDVLEFQSEFDHVFQRTELDDEHIKPLPREQQVTSKKDLPGVDPNRT